MKVRCPCCGAESSLDALVAHEEARNALWSLAQIGGGMTRGLVMYLGLFRPAKGSLSSARMAKLMAELLPDIRAEKIQRDGKVYPAPAAAWQYAFAEVLAARDAGTLKTPLKTHGYLYEIISRVRPDNTAPAEPGRNTPASRVRSGLQKLEDLK